jgi:hypothetical protein
MQPYSKSPAFAASKRVREAALRLVEYAVCLQPLGREPSRGDWAGGGQQAWIPLANAFEETLGRSLVRLERTICLSSCTLSSMYITTLILASVLRDPCPN